MTNPSQSPAVSDDMIVDAYRMFLGRTPADISKLHFDSFDALISNLYHSPEFRASPRARKNALTWPEAQYFVAPAQKVIYCPIGKNACSFFKQAMVKLGGHPHSATILRSVHMLTDHVKTGMQLSDYAPDDAESFMADPEMFRFAILRDPARRLLSAYIEKFVNTRTENTNVTHHTGPVVRAVQTAEGLETPDFARGISFQAFVDHITAMPAEQLDPHWRPQHLYLGAYEWPNLYTFDSLPRAVADLEARTGITLDATAVNRTGSGAGTPHQGAQDLLPPELDRLLPLSEASFLTPEIRERLTAYYATDYELIHSVNPRTAS
ncbi:sulfotransferase family 2 domain-containing protein [uncultured Sulfitobacter sp.]|uniref:sulfotransferase family 2 domain-containing protein n=1 Tax=uncultured Sulfitobacter sp. TaxID=191468 RepID=UPI00261AA087|nr:sulfotransferase family 2 domain-containing protein [uncultured Sulfitobacter sp.]